MARRKKQYRPKSRRGRKMGAIGGSNLTTLLAGIAGAVGANYLSAKVIAPALDGMGLDDKTKQIAADAAPLALSFLIPGKSGMLAAVKTGMAIGSGAKLLSGLTGIGAISPLAAYNVPAVGAMDYRSLPLRAASGIPNVSELTAMQVAGSC